MPVAWNEVIQRWGLLGLAIVIVALNLDKIGVFVDKLISRFVPSYESRAKERAHRREMEERHLSQVEQERVDTVLLFKDMMLEYRKRLDDLELENRRVRQEHESRMIELIRGYERMQAQVVEVMRDLTEINRAQTDRLDRISEYIRQKEY